MPDPDLRYLEYGEEDVDADLFGSDAEAEVAQDLTGLDVNPAQPIASSSGSGSGSAPHKRVSPRPVAGPGHRAEKEKGHGEVYSPSQRLEEIRGRRQYRQSPSEDRVGPRSLKALAMSVVRANAARIWDIGDSEYPLVADFVNELPMDQLSEIELNSPHVKKDTDWLWEWFLLQDFPLFHERCYLREGEPRTSGWRRMYKKAKEDAAERQQQAAGRLAARYRQLEEEKAAKRIVFVDKVVATKKPRGRAVPGGRSGFGGSTSSSSSKGSGSSAIAKARAEAQRARIALTHASGRYIPPPPTARPRPKFNEDDKFKNPYLTAAAGGSQPSQPGPSRLPAPKPVSARPPPNPSPRPTASSPFPGAYPASEAQDRRAALPSLFKSTAEQVRNISSNISSPRERFRISEKKEFKEIRRPEVPSFQAPGPTKPKSEVVMDFFGRKDATSARAGGMKDAGRRDSQEGVGVKRKAEEGERDGEIKRKKEESKGYKERKEHKEHVERKQHKPLVGVGASKPPAEGPKNVAARKSPVQAIPSTLDQSKFTSPTKPAHALPSSLSSPIKVPSTIPSAKMSPAAPPAKTMAKPNGMTADESAKLSSVLFRKKARPRV